MTKSKVAAPASLHRAKSLRENGLEHSHLLASLGRAVADHSQGLLLMDPLICVCMRRGIGDVLLARGCSLLV